MSTVRALLALCIMAAVCDAKLRFLSSKPVGAAEAQNAESVPAFRRSYTSGSAAASGSGTTTTPAPTPAATSPIQIVQVVTMSSTFTASTISTYAASAYATAVNFGYGHSIGIVTTTSTGTTYKTGCSVSSTAVYQGRRAAGDISITFTAQVAAAQAAAAQSASESLDAATLTTKVGQVIDNLKLSDQATYGTLTAPTASAVQSPTVTTTGGSASSNAVFSAVALLGAAAMALKQ